MSYIRKIRIEYYQIVIAKKDGTGRDKLYNLQILLDKALKLSLQDRTYKYYQENARLDKLSYHRSTDCYYLNFVRLRQTKIPVKAKLDSASEPLTLAKDEYIGEDVSAVYDNKNNILALQRNRDSLSSSGVEYYLTELLGTSVNGIYLRPVPLNNVDNKLKKAKIYRKMTLKLATDNLKKSKTPEESSFKKLLDFADPYQSKNVLITMSMGRYKGSMARDVIAKVIRDAKNSDGIVTGAEISVKYNDDEPVDTIDLFAMKYHNFISIKMEALKSIDFIEMCNEIRVTYLNNRKDILAAISGK